MASDPVLPPLNLALEAFQKVAWERESCGEELEGEAEEGLENTEEKTREARDGREGRVRTRDVVG